MRDHACIDNGYGFDSNDTTVISIVLSSSGLEMCATINLDVLSFILKLLLFKELKLTIFPFLPWMNWNRM
jgi:hypothetical protein